MIKIAALVEGHGECDAVPVLIRRIALGIDPGFVPKIFPLKFPSNQLRNAIERSVELAARKLQRQGGIVIIIDCDDGCPRNEGPALLSRAQKACSDMPISVILAKKEFEAWFIASAESLRGKRGLSQHMKAPESPEEIRGAKEWLSAEMPRNKPYSETTHQSAFAECFDMQLARRRSDSFDKCYRDIEGMLRRLGGY
ncbi:MAG: DUF4276 family protein [Elusimicrobiales bacterium]